MSNMAELHFSKDTNEVKFKYRNDLKQIINRKK